MTAKPVEKKPMPEDVLKFSSPTQGYLCPITANRFGVDFMEFKIRDAETNRIIFHVRRDPDSPTIPLADLDDSSRFIQYDFSSDFLSLRNVGAMLVFKVGSEPLPCFRMIERHYFRNKLIKSFDFSFGFCIPNSTNEWEVIYELPKLSASERSDMISHPYLTQSDSFYFVGNELIMHNKASYAYVKK